MNFTQFRDLVNQKLSGMVNSNQPLFITYVDPDTLWQQYLLAYPEADRQSHNCNACRQFIKKCGAIVTINDDLSLTSIWDVEATNDYANVAKELTKLVVSYNIKDVFVTNERRIGCIENYAQTEAGVVKWTHFYGDFKTCQDPNAEINDKRTGKETFQRALDEISIEVTETVLDLIAQNSLYRGAEYKSQLESFLQYQQDYLSVVDKKFLEHYIGLESHSYTLLRNNFLNSSKADSIRNIYAWLHSYKAGAALSRIRNSAIGTLLVDLSKGMDLDAAVRRFESVVAPTNYKRPNPVVSAAMVTKAQETIVSLGYETALRRRYATKDDINVNNVLFVDRSNPVQDIFAELKGDVPVNPKSFSRIEEVTIDKFLLDIVPNATGLEILLDNSHSGNFMTLIAPEDKEAPSFFKWDNGFSWSYNNALADSMKEKVKAAGGKVDGVFRASLEWYNFH